MYNKNKFLMLLEDVSNQYHYDAYNYSWIEILCVDPKYRRKPGFFLYIFQSYNACFYLKKTVYM